MMSEQAEDLRRTLLIIARTIEESLAKRDINFNEMREALRLVHDMQREARDGTLTLAALPSPPAESENK